jgi:hypothetical protein
MQYPPSSTDPMSHRNTLKATTRRLDFIGSRVIVIRLRITDYNYSIISYYKAKTGKGIRVTTAL